MGFEVVSGLDGAVARARALADRAGADRRAVLGITGAPGAGKSTLAGALVAALGPATAALVPMDGFHLADPLLRALGRWDRKGAPDTFDGDAYADLLARLRDRRRPAFVPLFDRARELAEVGAALVPEGVPLVVTEGNYLLLASAPWGRVAGLLDECWYAEVDEGLRRRRLQARHEAHGRDPEEARSRTTGSDEANARLVAATRHRATALVRL